MNEELVNEIRGRINGFVAKVKQVSGAAIKKAKPVVGRTAYEVNKLKDKVVSFVNDVRNK